MTDSKTSPVALVTGANRGIGLEVVRQLAQAGMTVFLGSHDLEKGKAASQPLIEAGLNVIPCQLDVTQPTDIDQVIVHIEQAQGQLDVLVNNAGILYDTWQTAATADLSVVQTALKPTLLRHGGSARRRCYCSGAAAMDGL